MHCPHCASPYTHRSRRRGMRDRVAVWLNRWPYRCDSCGLRFWSNQRFPVPAVPSWQAPRPVTCPTAKIEVRAASQTELDQMLLSLNQALQQFHTGPGSKPEQKTQPQATRQISTSVH